MTFHYIPENQNDGTTQENQNNPSLPTAPPSSFDTDDFQFLVFTKPLPQSVSYQPPLPWIHVTTTVPLPPPSSWWRSWSHLEGQTPQQEMLHVWIKFMAWNSTAIPPSSMQQHERKNDHALWSSCSTIVYHDEHVVLQDSPHWFRRIDAMLQQQQSWNQDTSGGWMQFPTRTKRKKGMTTVDSEWQRLLEQPPNHSPSSSSSSSSRLTINQTLVTAQAWLHHQPHYEPRMQLYSSELVAYNPRSPSFRFASTEFWKLYATPSLWIMKPSLGLLFLPTANPWPHCGDCDSILWSFVLWKLGMVPHQFPFLNTNQQVFTSVAPLP